MMSNVIPTRPTWKPRARAYLRLKSAVDFGIALILFLLALPVMVLAGLLVKLTSHGPILYSQTRVGRFGQPFRIWKIRSMRHNCESSSGAKWCTSRDPRVTFIGKILRKLHIDELPQLWNIIRGDMSLVGPRPERPEFVTVLDELIEGYSGRLTVKPGLTGLAQIQLPPDTDLESVRKKVALDLVYIDRIGPWLDIRLMLGTVVYLLGFSYAWVRRIMRLPTADVIPALLPKEQPSETESPLLEDRRSAPNKHPQLQLTSA
jgi:lipopolysaccharide/colanic/teichoic acid biosynthesis glycosyltransferase